MCSAHNCWCLVNPSRQLPQDGNIWNRKLTISKNSAVCSGGYWGSDLQLDQWTRQAAYAGWVWEVVANVIYFLDQFMRTRYSFNPEIFLILLPTSFPSHRELAQLFTEKPPPASLSVSVSESSRMYILLRVKNPRKFPELAFLLTCDVLGPAAACTGCMRAKRAGAKSHIEGKMFLPSAD